MDDPLARLPRRASERLVPAAQPSWLDPMLATRTDRRFSDPGWIFEPKLDGERCLAFRKGEQVRLLSRNRTPLEDRYPELVDALAWQGATDFVVDGEIVAYADGRPSFARLQRRMQLPAAEAALRADLPVLLYLFDVVHAGGNDLTRLGTRDRKAVLLGLLSFTDPLRYTAHRVAEGEAYYREACRKGWGGVVAKRADAPYVQGRSRDWLKLTCVREQELVIGGYTEPKGSRRGLGALLLGYYRGPDLVYAGKVGTGFDTGQLQGLRSRLETMEMDRPPFTMGRPPSPTSGTHWVRPELVAQVRFAEWTEDGRLRQPRFLGLRDDKGPRAVVQEQPR